MKNKLFYLLLAACILTGCSNKGLTESTEGDIRTFDTDMSIENARYVSETTYGSRSSKDLPAELYELSFDFGGDSQYVSNKELTEYIGGNENILPYLETAENALILNFAQNGYSIKEAEYREKVRALYKSTQGIMVGEEVYSAEDYALHLYKLFVDNKVCVNGEFKTDPSLFWQSKYMYYVRGVLTLNLEEDANKVFCKEFGIPLDNSNETLQLIVHVKFIPGNAQEILGIDIVGAI